MKSILVFCFCLLVLAACHNYKREAKRLMIEKDSISEDAAQKDSSLVEIVVDFNEILTTLDSIKKVEKLITIQSAANQEMNYRQKKLILEDIKLLNELIQKNKEQLVRVQLKLNTANSQIGNLNLVLAEFEELAKILDQQIKEKDTEIVELATEVQKLSKNVSVLNEKIIVIELENAQKTDTIEKQIQELNKAYYAYGSSKELRENGVIEASGGFVGVGRTITMKDDFNKEYFTEVDIRNLNIIPLMVKKAEVISVHTAGSFHISGEKTADTLFIDNRTEFWKASRFLVIVTK